MRRRRSPPRLLDAVRRSPCGSFDVEATLNGERDFRWHRLPEMDADGLLLQEAAEPPRDMAGRHGSRVASTASLRN